MLRVLLIWLAGVLVIGLGGPAFAGKSQPAPQPTDSWQLAISVMGAALPTTPGTEGLDYAVAGEPFAVTVTSLYDDNVEDRLAPKPTPLSSTSAVKIVLTVPSGVTGNLDPRSIPAGQTTVTFPGLQRAAAGSDLVMQAKTQTGSLKVSGTETFDVLIEDTDIDPEAARTTIGGASVDVYEGCNVTEAKPICADLLPPTGQEFAAGGLLSRGMCVGSDCKDSYIQPLVAFTQPTTDGTADRADPATLIMKCDKTLCGQGGINKQKLTVELRPADDATQAPACPAKGVVDTDQLFCVDYVQSTRDNAGDTFLYLLFVVDAKVRFP
jgi:hypothetical protein